ncbi:MAG: 30S ribosomal protein S6 [Nitrospiria bacterium]
MGTKTKTAPGEAAKDHTMNSETALLKPFETIFILKPALGDEDITTIIDKMKGIIEQEGGEIVAVENWGKRKLAYEVQSERKGIYVVIHFKGPSRLVRELERNYRISESIIKYITLTIGADKLGQALPVKEEKTFVPRGRNNRNWR